jgi:acetyltransferase-like isoleucine patch superfamily enzyme
MSSLARRQQMLHFLRRIRLATRFYGQAIRVDPTCWVSARSEIRTRGGGSITVGKHCEIHPYSMMLTYGGDIRVGDHCSLNPFSIIYGQGGVRIGDGVRIAAQTVIIPGNHVVSSEGKWLIESGVVGGGIEICDNVWLGAGVVVLDGVVIGRDAVVAAGSVVTKAVPERVTVAGVPARVIADRSGSER